MVYMIEKQNLIALAVACALMSVANADCILPPAPSKVPDGATATDQEMQVAMTTMSHYEKDVESYLKCLEFEARQGRVSADERARLSSEALQGHQAVITGFNAQMRVYMSR